jgi:antitoxin (DNA-binding transcriptional repressor) of toxin-antitoxin stability system
MRNATLRALNPCTFNGPLPPTIITAMEQLNIGWDGFYLKISKRHGLLMRSGNPIRIFDDPNGSYLQEVEECQEAFRKSASFEAMPLEDRKLVAGWGDRSKGWFGSMKGAGTFMNITGQRPHSLSLALESAAAAGRAGSARARGADLGSGPWKVSPELRSLISAGTLGQAGSSKLFVNRRIVITRHGKAVARLVPAERGFDSGEGQARRRRFARSQQRSKALRPQNQRPRERRAPVSLVIDNSVALAWCFEDEHTQPILDLLDRVTETGAVAPSLWPLEALNALLMAERRKRLDGKRRERLAGFLRSLPVALDTCLLLKSISRPA